MNPSSSSFFFFNDTATTEIYTLSLHDALPISLRSSLPEGGTDPSSPRRPGERGSPILRPTGPTLDRKSTRLNSSHLVISYAVFCLKKKKKTHHKSNTGIRLRRIRGIRTPIRQT